MDGNVVWWSWIIVGAIFLLIELFTSTFFGLWMAIAAAVTAVLSFLISDMHLGSQIGIWIVSMIISAYLWVRISKRNNSNTSIQDTVIGQIGILSRGSASEKQGLLILQKPVEGRTEWKCVSDDEIAPDSRVVVKEKVNHDVLRVVISKSSHS
ncbi:NfeD family protein [Klebsiella sp. CN_Kp114]|uniref:NfeD family protein n=1 Tax=unclassified Klebsiella TaxID=2608929 RepID=UPI0032B31019